MDDNAEVISFSVENTAYKLNTFDFGADDTSVYCMGYFRKQAVLYRVQDHVIERFTDPNLLPYFVIYDSKHIITYYRNIIHVLKCIMINGNRSFELVKIVNTKHGINKIKCHNGLVYVLCGVTADLSSIINVYDNWQLRTTYTFDSESVIEEFFVTNNNSVLYLQVSEVNPITRIVSQARTLMKRYDITNNDIIYLDEVVIPLTRLKILHVAGHFIVINSGVTNQTQLLKNISYPANFDKFVSFEAGINYRTSIASLDYIYFFSISSNDTCTVYKTNIKHYIEDINM